MTAYLTWIHCSFRHWGELESSSLGSVNELPPSSTLLASFANTPFSLPFLFLSQARLKSSPANGNGKAKGKLAAQLEAEKKKSTTQVLSDASQAERDARRADNNEELRRWD